MIIDHTTKVTQEDGRVRVSLPNDAFLLISPENARQLAGLMLIGAHRAEALAVPARFTVNVPEAMQS
jgi:hypothetical protein